jgi:hypothetical protein
MGGISCGCRKVGRFVMGPTVLRSSCSRIKRAALSPKSVDIQRAFLLLRSAANRPVSRHYSAGRIRSEY